MLRQLELLQNRGMFVDNVSNAVSFMETVSYYRLRAYWKPFEMEGDPPGEYIFQNDLNFWRISSLYIFDRKLRMLLFDGIERIEVALRTKWNNLVAQKYGPHGYLNKKYFKENYHQQNVLDLHRVFIRSKDEFAKHYKKTYSSPYLPPVWVATELMSFGLLSKFIKNLVHRVDRNVLAHSFILDEKVLTSFLEHLSIVRNICAHHGRIWNRSIPKDFVLPNAPSELNASLNCNSRKYLYNTLVMIIHILGFINLDNEDNDWKKNLILLLENNPEDLYRMGFPEDWRERNIWRSA